MKNYALFLCLLLIGSCTKKNDPNPVTLPNSNNNGTINPKTITATIYISTIKGYPAKYLQASVNGGTLSPLIAVTAAKVIATLKSDGSDTARVDIINETTPTIKDFSFYVFIRNDSIKIHSAGLQAGTDFTYADGSALNYKMKYPNVPYDVTFFTALNAGAYQIDDMVTNSSLGVTQNSFVLSY